MTQFHEKSKPFLRIQEGPPRARPNSGSRLQHAHSGLRQYPGEPDRYHLPRTEHGGCRRPFDRGTLYTHCGPLRGAELTQFPLAPIGQKPDLFECAPRRHDIDTLIQDGLATPPIERVQCQTEKLSSRVVLSRSGTTIPICTSRSSLSAFDEFDIMHRLHGSSRQFPANGPLAACSCYQSLLLQIQQMAVHWIHQEPSIVRRPIA